MIIYILFTIVNEIYSLIIVSIVRNYKRIFLEFEVLYCYLLMQDECDRVDKNKEIINEFVIDGFEYSMDNVELETLEVI